MSKQQLKKAEQAAAPAVPFDEADYMMGFEEADQESFAIPRLTILQQLSPQLEDNEQLKAGMIYDTVSEVGYSGDDGILVIPVHFQRRFVEWQPRESGGGFVAEHRPGEEPDGERDGGRIVLSNGNYLDDARQHYVLYQSEYGWVPALISMTSTQIRKSKRWLTMMKMARKPMFAFAYRLTTVKESNDKGRWHGWAIKRDEPVTDAELVEMARELHATVSAGNVQVRYDDADEEMPF